MKSNRHILIICLLLLAISYRASAEIVEESGSLLEFFAGVEEECAYDNWVSHISEGIARAGYNDYAPPEHDRQTNGFGDYQIVDSLENPDEVIADWYSIFANIISGDPETASEILDSSDFADIYELVLLEDGERNYIILREVLNDEYFDDNGTEDESDDVTGSFDYGWGLYVFNLDAVSSSIAIEIPHPCDDYITPFVGIDAFLSLDALALFVSGSGREVKWTEVGAFDNSKTMSDPTRTRVRSAFQQAHKTIVDSIESEFVMQIHSYDSGGRNLRPILLSTYPDNYPNAPLYDADTGFDIINLTERYPILANTIGNEDHDSLRIDDYYAIWNYGDSIFYNDELLISSEMRDLQGWDSPQRHYSLARRDTVTNVENFLHIEHDELPDVINEALLDYYPADGVPTFETYATASEFNRPLYTAVERYFFPSRIHHVPADFETIQSAIDSVIDGDTVLVHPGTYIENIDFIGKDIVLGSLFLTTGDTAYIDSTVIDGNRSGSVVKFQGGESSSTILTGLILRNGSGTNIDEDRLMGGGIFCENSSPSIKHCIIVENMARAGGGIYCYQNSNPTIENCIIRGNEAGYGGGIYCIRSTNMNVLNTLVYENSADTSGAGILCSRSRLEISHCVIYENEVGVYGGGIYSVSDTLSILNCVISNNVSRANGGGIECWGSNIVMANSVMWNNSNEEIYFRPEGRPVTLTISNSDINGGEDGIVDNNNGQVNWLDGNIDADPLFADPDNGDYTLTEDSPCVDAGTAFFVWNEDTLLNLSEDDYNGFAPDMGAFESPYSNFVSDFLLPPLSFTLSTAYPNPFNSTTQISYSLPVASRVSLRLFDLSGRIVKMLEEGKRREGVHRTMLNGADLPSGLYFVRLEAAGQVATQKVMLVR